MKSLASFVMLATLIIATRGINGSNRLSAPAPPDPNVPKLTLDEKVSLTTDDIKRQDMLEKAQEEFQRTIKPINDHQEATKKVIESEHPGWILQLTSAQGWQLMKKPELQTREQAGEQAGAAEEMRIGSMTVVFVIPPSVFSSGSAIV